MESGSDVRDFGAFGLAAQVSEGVREAGFAAPRPVQARVIPAALAGRDVLALARTGTGKTAAFALPILDAVVRQGSGPDPKALVLAPTRELARQIEGDFVRLGAHVDCRVVLLIGGEPVERQAERVRTGCDVVVATPGRLLEHVRSGACALDAVAALVLDEADRLIDLGFLADVQRIVRRVADVRQTMLFSATMPESLQALAQGLLRDPEIVDLGNAAPAETIDHTLLPVRASAKTKLLVAVLSVDEFRSAIVFVRTKQRAKAVFHQLQRRGFDAELLHGDRKQGARDRALAKFRAGEAKVLVATDLASRGLDVEAVSHVVSYDVPLDPDAYVHRIGRTGRAERSGVAFTLVARGDLGAIRAIEHRIGARLERRTWPGFAELDDEDLARS